MGVGKRCGCLMSRCHTVQEDGTEINIGVVTDMITNDEMSRAGLANDLLEVELLNEEGYEDADGGPVRETPTVFAERLTGLCVLTHLRLSVCLRQVPVYTCLVPFVKAIVPDVDKKRRVLRIDPPPGLLELAVEKVCAIEPAHPAVPEPASTVG